VELNKVICGDCLEVMRGMEDNSVDCVVCDPPYGLSFMGKKWDYDVPSVAIWRECLRVLKHGGYLLSFAGTRTQHRMAVNIEDAGFEIRDMIAWVYGSGFPKSLNIGKAVDKLQGNEREPDKYTGANFKNNVYGKGNSPYEGWGTALKPALEPITVARKPLEKGLTVAENVLKWGTGGINIDGCRVEGKKEWGSGHINFAQKHAERNELAEQESFNRKERENEGRFPANLIHDGSDEVVGLFPNTKSGNLNSGHKRGDGTGNSFMGGGGTVVGNYGGDSGSASRFFYCAKASKSERNMGCEELEDKVLYEADNNHGNLGHFLVKKAGGDIGDKIVRKNNHPTVKPIALMEYLVKLVSRESALVLDSFAGSGSTGLACQNLSRNYILIEREKEYCDIAEHRLKANKNKARQKVLNI